MNMFRVRDFFCFFLFRFFGDIILSKYFVPSPFSPCRESTVYVGRFFPPSGWCFFVFSTL